MRRSFGLFLVMCGCATGRTYKTDRFEMKIGDETNVAQQSVAKGTEWKFSDEKGRQFLGASTYPVSGDPTFPCGIPEVEVNGTKAFFVRRTYLRPEPVIASLIFPQANGTVLEFSYLEKDERARALVATIKVAAQTERPPSCEVIRSGGPLKADTYDAGLFSAKLLPGAWLLDSRHFGSQDRDSLGGGWYFEQASTGTIFLFVQGYPRHPHVSRRCERGPPVEFNGTCAFRCRDTDGLEPYAGPSNVTLTVPVESGDGGEYFLDFQYDEHAPTAGLAERTLESVRVRHPDSKACAR